MILLVSLLIIGVIATYSGKIAEKFKLPALIGMMVLGIIIGPSFLNVVLYIDFYVIHQLVQIYLCFQV